MSKKLSYKGIIPEGLQERIRLATKDGKRGYKIVKFAIFPQNPGDSADKELIVQVFTRDQSGSITKVVDFSRTTLLAVSYYTEGVSITNQSKMDVIFDNAVFNQDIYITAVDGTGGTQSTNYYIELETIPLSDAQSTQLTLKNLRAIFG
jgi:archaellum component FlaF (FlaF/FlaG flagellin family)